MQLIAAVGIPAVVIAGAAVWLLVRAEMPRRRALRARGVRRLTEVCGAVVLVTVVFLRPWYWDVAIATVTAVGVLAVRRMATRLEHRRVPAPAGAVVTAMAAVLMGSLLVTLAGTAAVLDGAALAGGRPVPVSHDNQVLAQPVLYQLFLGPSWAATPSPPALADAASFQRGLARSVWTTSVVTAGFGVRSVSSGGCFIDPGPAPARPTIASMASGPFPAELHAVFGGRRPVLPCPGFSDAALPRALPADAVVAVWLGPDQVYALGGVSAHGAVPWPGRIEGVAAAGLTGAFATWGQSSCASHLACRGLPAGITPVYALSHELVEATTNPFGNGWYADTPVQWSARYFLSHGPTSLLGTAPQFQGEVADLCEPGQPDAISAPVVAPRARAHAGVRALGTAPFYRPGVGCSS